MSAMKAIVNYSGAFELRYSVTFAEAGIKEIVDNTIPSRYLHTQSRRNICTHNPAISAHTIPFVVHPVLERRPTGEQ